MLLSLLSTNFRTKGYKHAIAREVDSEEDLRLVHEVLLHAEKDRLWREISADAENERLSGKWERLPEIINEVRSQLRRA